MQSPTSKDLGIDKDQPAPVIQPRKKTTQVNIWMAVAVALFLILAAIAVAWFEHHPGQVSNQVDQQIKAPAR